ncbi:hypothetical protein H0N96_00020 [Candidatus Micrarchaeota archaeon]|nr:hypothetical protein [Candidatus Micrarchaeota archaeon]
MNWLYYLGIALFAVGILGFAFYFYKYYSLLKEKHREHAHHESDKHLSDKKKKLVAKSFACLAIALIGLLLTAFAPPESALAAPAVGGDLSALLARGKIIEEKTETYVNRLTPIKCLGQEDVVYWRELKVFNTTTKDASGNTKTTFYSTITLNIQNVGPNKLSDVTLLEKIPDSIARVPEDITEFSITPKRVVKGSVVVEWLFSYVEPGEKKQVSYTVEKRLDASALNDFGAPEVVAQAIEGPTAPSVAPEQPAAAGMDYTIIGLVIVVVTILALLYAFVLKKKD